MRFAGIALVAVAMVAIGGFALSSFVNGRDSASLSSDAEDGPGAPRTDADALGGAGDVGVPGNVVLLHAAASDGPALQALAQDVAGPASPELEAAGQAIIVRQAPEARGIVAVSANRILRVPSADDPALREFVQAWLAHPDAS